MNNYTLLKLKMKFLFKCIFVIIIFFFVYFIKLTFYFFFSFCLVVFWKFCNQTKLFKNLNIFFSLIVEQEKKNYTSTRLIFIIFLIIFYIISWILLLCLLLFLLKKYNLLISFLNLIISFVFILINSTAIIVVWDWCTKLRTRLLFKNLSIIFSAWIREKIRIYLEVGTWLLDIYFIMYLFILIYILNELDILDLFMIQENEKIQEKTLVVLTETETEIETATEESRSGVALLVIVICGVSLVLFAVIEYWKK